MPAGVRATQAAVRVSPAAQKPYAVLFLPAVFQGTPQKQELLLPLTLAYLLSAHIPFRFPLRESALAVVERAFDDILSGLPKESKGICYECVGPAQDASVLVPQSSLLVTDDGGLRALCDGETLPAAVISHSETKAHGMRLHNLEKISDARLRAKLASCARLINSQSDGFTTEGHFSLSW